MSKPWMKFYPADWRDPRLRQCSLAARGLWIDLIGYMHEAEPYGHLLIAGQVLADSELALHLARPHREVRRALEELEDNGVFSRRENGCIFSRRMVRDFEKAETDKANGRGGGNPSLIQSDKGGVNPPDKAQKLEARDQNSEKEIKKYAFESGVIRLSEKHFEQWRANFSFLDVGAELIGMTKWAEEQGQNWFHAVSGLLAKRNREAKAAAEKAKEGGGFKYMSGIPGVV